MSLPLIIYLISVSSSICTGATIIFIVGCIGIALGGMILIHQYDDEDKERLRKLIKRMLMVSVASFIVASVLPSEKTAYTMLAAYGVESVASNENTQRIAGKSLQLIEQTIDGYLKEEKTPNE